MRTMFATNNFAFIQKYNDAVTKELYNYLSTGGKAKIGLLLSNGQEIDYPGYKRQTCFFKEIPNFGNDDRVLFTNETDIKFEGIAGVFDIEGITVQMNPIDLEIISSVNINTKQFIEGDILCLNRGGVSLNVKNWSKEQ